jgi:hypothetical protein
VNKLLLGALLGALLAAAAPAKAQSHRDKGCATPPCTIISGVAPIYLYNSAGPSQFVSSSTLATATNLPNIPATATIVEIWVQGTGSVMYRDDGTPPTASVGLGTITAGTPFQYAGALSAIQFITASGSPSLAVGYYTNN